MSNISKGKKKVKYKSKKKSIKIVLFFVCTVLIFSFKPVPIFASNVGLIENVTWQSNLTAVRFGSAIWGDIDNDGDLDLSLVGCLGGAGGHDCDNGVINKIYINNGTSLLENTTWEQNLTGLGYSSSAFGDINNDGKLDLAVCGCTNGTYDPINCAGNTISKIYINNGTSLVENTTWEQNLTGVFECSSAFGDINNDGKLDLGLTGNAGTVRIAKIYINNGTSLVENTTWEQNLTGIYQGAIAFGDIDNDNSLDLALIGRDTNANDRAKIYINNGTSLLENTTWEQNLTSADYSSLALGDYNNDGDLDLIEMGLGDYLILYDNTGSTLRKNQTYSVEGGIFAGVYWGSLAWGDYDNDGDLDLIATGYEETQCGAYENNQSNNYIFVVDTTLRPIIRADDMHQSSIAFGDVDDDGSLDLVSVGLNTAQGVLAKLYINNITTPNRIPNSPNSSFSSSYSNGILTLSWGNGSDNETPAAGLYYNLRVGTVIGGNDTVSGKYGGSSNPTAGYFGNMMQRKSIALRLPNIQANTTYYWSVQTIDTGLRASSWSAEQNFTLPMDVTAPSITINTPIINYNTTNYIVIFNVTASDNANLTNVTLYGSWGAWHLNESNSSGINNTFYVFTKNLSSYGDGDYTWGIAAFDASNNSLSINRTFRIDTTLPVINLVSPSDSSSWTSSSIVTFTYNVSDLWINNCSLIINGAIDQTDTSITVNANQTFSKSLGNGAYTWSINCTDSVGYTNKSVTRTLTVSYTPPSDGGGGGGGGAATTTTTTATSRTWSSINPGTTATMTISKTGLEFTEISFEVVNQASNVKIVVDSIEKPSTPQPSEYVYQYINISHENINDTNIKSAIINFKVNRTWIISNDINKSTVSLNRYTTGWQKLSTNLINETTEFIYYKAETSGFSVFAITAEKLAEKPKPAEAICGNDIRESGEECDGSDLANQTCISLGYISGTLRCSNCRFDIIACINLTAICGNNICEYGETVENCPEDCKKEVMNYSWLYLLSIIIIATISGIYWFSRKKF